MVFGNRRFSQSGGGESAYNWWNYEHRQMMGLFVGAWSGLPIEGACVWMAVAYATVIVFEVMKVLLASERSVRDTLLGASRVPDPRLAPLLDSSPNQSSHSQTASTEN
jgi:hypothetical protein